MEQQQRLKLVDALCRSLVSLLAFVLEFLDLLLERPHQNRLDEPPARRAARAERDGELPPRSRPTNLFHPRATPLFPCSSFPGFPDPWRFRRFLDPVRPDRRIAAAMEAAVRIDLADRVPAIGDGAAVSEASEKDVIAGDHWSLVTFHAPAVTR